MPPALPARLPAKARRRQQKNYFSPSPPSMSQPLSHCLNIYNAKWLYEWCLCSHTGKFFIRFFICCVFHLLLTLSFSLSSCYTHTHTHTKFPFGTFLCLLQRERAKERKKGRKKWGKRRNCFEVKEYLIKFMHIENGVFMPTEYVMSSTSPKLAESQSSLKCFFRNFFFLPLHSPPPTIALLINLILSCIKRERGN